MAGSSTDAIKSTGAIKIFAKTSLKTLGKIEVLVSEGDTIDIVELTAKAREKQKLAADEKKTEKTAWTRHQQQPSTAHPNASEALHHHCEDPITSASSKLCHHLV